MTIRRTTDDSWCSMGLGTANTKVTTSAPADCAASALTLIEVLVVVVVLTFLVLLSVRAWHPVGPDRTGINCLNNLKQIGVSAETWAMDNGNQFPWQVPADKLGSSEAGSGNPVPQLCAMSNELSTPRILACEADERECASNFASLSRRNVSYFLGTDAVQRMPKAILAGDRNLIVNGREVQPGPFALTADAEVTWTRRLHTHINKFACGNLLLEDGHAELVSTNTRSLVAGQGVATNHLEVP
jgi:hypothetical protein